MAITQAGRLLSISTPLGKDVLLLEGLDGQEELSSLFQFTLFLLSENPSVPFGDIVGKSATIQIEGKSGPRYIHGFINQFSQGPSTGSVAHYYATLVPWLWNLTQTADC